LVLPMDVSIIIPAYNEEKRILITLERTTTFLAQRPWSCELLIVDDGSGDATVERVRDYASQREAEPLIRCLENGRNRGKGYSIRHGVGEAQGNCVGFMDGDYKTDIAGLDAVMPLLAEGCDGVIGDRSLSETRIEVARRGFRQLGSQLFRRLLHKFMGLKDFGDTQCGFKFFQAPVARDLFARQKIDGFMFDVEILLLASRCGYRIAKIPVVWSDDPDSRFNPVTGTLRDLKELLHIHWLHRR